MRRGSGPMARTVADAALLLSVMAGPDPRSPIALPEPGARFAGPLAADIRGLRVAWSPDLGGAVPVEPEVAAAVRDAAQVFAGLGARVTEGSPDFAGADEAFRTLRAWQFEVMLGELLDRHPGELKGSLRQNIELGRKLTGPELGRAEQLHTALFHRVRIFFSAHDLLLLPVSQGLRHRAGVPGRGRRGGDDGLPGLDAVRVSGLGDRLPGPLRARPASAPAACRSGCRSSGRTAPTSRSFRPGTPSSRPPRPAAAARPACDQAPARPVTSRPARTTPGRPPSVAVACEVTGR